MTARRRRSLTFLRDEAGAVTVEYVELAAAVTAMAIASSDVINRGLAALAGTVDSELSGDPVGGSAGLGYDDGFDNGSPGWTGATASTIRGYGNVLGPVAGSRGAEAISKEFAIAPGAAATFRFDVIAGDSLDGESGIVFIDGLEVGRVTTDWQGATMFTPMAGLAERGISITGELIDSGTDLGGPADKPAWVDSRTSVSISIANPAERVRFGFGSDADQGLADEFFAIDTFKATGLADPGQAG